VAAAQICEGLGFDAIQVCLFHMLGLCLVKDRDRPYVSAKSNCHAVKVKAIQTCHLLLFHQKSACDALAEVMLRYISEIGIVVHQCAERAGRTEGNVHDILAAFDQLGTSMRSVMEYGTKSEEVPFARPLPRFPLQKVPRLPPRCVARRVFFTKRTSYLGGTCGEHCHDLESSKVIL
jgi:histone H3/H4